VIGGPELRDALGKLLDCVAICAPHVAQEAALYGLGRLDRWVAARRGEVNARGAALVDALRGSNSGFELVSVGAFFAWVRHPFEGVPSVDVARRLASECAIRALPGSMFGTGQEDYLRFACANLDVAQMPEVARRLGTLGNH
jgi:aspartate/methionine/tyrosine aminotransferase